MVNRIYIAMTDIDIEKYNNKDLNKCMNFARI